MFLLSGEQRSSETISVNSMGKFGRMVAEDPRQSDPENQVFVRTPLSDSDLHIVLHNEFS